MQEKKKRKKGHVQLNKKNWNLGKYSLKEENHHNFCLKTMTENVRLKFTKKLSLILIFPFQDVLFFILIK